MNKKIKTLIAVGGPGGHVFPGCNLASHLNDQNYKVKIVSDLRGSKYLNQYKNFDISILPSSPLILKNPISMLLSLGIMFYSILRSLIFLIFNRPKLVFGMGGYASFPICIAAYILNIKFIVYENNLVIGKANKYLLPFAYKIFVSNKNLEGISKKYQNKAFEIGNIIKKEIINFSNNNKNKKDSKKMNILVLGGSQAAEIFANKLPEIFVSCSREGMKLKIFQHCLPNQNKKLISIYKRNNIESELFNFSNNLNEYFSKTNLAITRSGSSVLAELTNANIPFICVPLPSSADKHQLKNATFYEKRNLAFLVEEEKISNKLQNLIKEFYYNASILENIINNQSQYSDKNVYKNIDHILKKITNEKN